MKSNQKSRRNINEVKKDIYGLARLMAHRLNIEVADDDFPKVTWGSTTYIGEQKIINSSYGRIDNVPTIHIKKSDVGDGIVYAEEIMHWLMDHV